MLRYLITFMLLACVTVRAQDCSAYYSVIEDATGFPLWSSRPYDYAAAYEAYPSAFNQEIATLAYSNGPAHGRGANAFAGSSVLADGRVVLVPLNSSYVGILSGGSNTLSTDAVMSPLFNGL